MSTIQSSGTRSGRLRLVARLEMARHAADLLHSKEEALERERTRLGGYRSRAETAWRLVCDDAEATLVRARTLGAGDELRRLTGRDAAPASVTLHWQTSMGIVYPGSIECHPGAAPSVTSTAALAPAIDAYRAALDAAAATASTTAAVQRLDSELSATRRRRRAIEERLQPRLETALRELDLRLDELDREEALRVHVASALQEAHRPC